MNTLANSTSDGGLVLDQDTAAVLSTLVLNVILGPTILVTWLVFRRFRGDKQNVTRHMSEATEIHFDENYVPNGLMVKQKDY